MIWSSVCPALFYFSPGEPVPCHSRPGPAASCHRCVSPQCLQQPWHSNAAVMTAPERDGGSCWETLFMMVYGICVAGNCIKNISISQVIQCL